MRGTWIHPKVAVHLGQWCSAKFAVAVSGWILEWAEQRSKSRLPYHLDRYLANNANVPAGHFSMLAEMAICLIAPLEQAGYTLPEHLVPDISEGQIFCKWLRTERGVDTDALPTYLHDYQDGRIELLPDLRKHFASEWLPNRAQKYFADRDAKALQFLPKLLPPSAPSKTRGTKVNPFSAIKSAVASTPTKPISLRQKRKPE